MNSTTPVAVALGSNLGDRDAHLDFAVSRLSALLTELRASARIDTAPVDIVGDQPWYLNAVVVGRTSATPLDLLLALQQIERERGRERPYVNAPRTLDLDLVLYGEVIVASPELTLPHPRFRDRRFVLAPLAEVAPAMVDPVSGLTVVELLRRLS